MINTRKIKGRMVELGITQKDLSKAIGISQTAVCQKLSNKRPMNLKEAEEISRLLCIGNEEFSIYFFENEVAQSNKRP